MDDKGDKPNKISRPVGRPKIVETPEEMDALFESYCKLCSEDEIPITLTGAILALGLSSKEAFYQYGRRAEFVDSVKKIRLAVENAYETNLHRTGCTGSIFALKNMGWHDKQIIEDNRDFGSMIDRKIRSTPGLAEKLEEDFIDD